MIEWIGIILIVVTIVLNFVAINRIGKADYKDAKAALWSGAILAIIGTIVVVAGIALSSSAKEAADIVKDDPELLAPLV